MQWLKILNEGYLREIWSLAFSESGWLEEKRVYRNDTKL